ncbi:MAG: hypothetical protein JWN65_2178 [Solirubrobacterales bacterium]|nr:hypothetical protein [Solirubrobacterales bacterium]
MSSQRTMSGTGARTTDEDVADRAGWVAFAGVMLSIVGVLNIVYGIAAIDDAKFYINDARFVISNLSLWGWVLLVVGTVQVCAAASIFAGTAWGRWVGILTAGVNSIALLMLLPAYPFLALALFAVDILVIYGLLSDSGRRDRI